jgi:uncharacterized protein YrzB (UPF0473 family)
MSNQEELLDDVERIFIEDDQGVEHEYEIIMYLEPDGSEHKYVILMPVDEEDDSEEAEVVPFRYTEEGDEIKLFPLETEEEWQLVGETFFAIYNDEEEEPEQGKNN